MARRNPVIHTPVEETAVSAFVKADNAERGIKEVDVRGQAIVAKIRERYSIQAEEAILRKAIYKLALGQQPSEEFFDYHNYVEECKKEVDDETLNN